MMLNRYPTPDNDNSEQQAASKSDGSRHPAFPAGVSPFSRSSQARSSGVDSSRSLTRDSIAAQHRETPRAAAAFQLYAEMGLDRSLVKLKAQLDQMKPKSSPTLATLKNWSSYFHWQDRVRQYDAEEAEKRRRKNAEAVERMNDEQALIGRTHLLRAVSAMEPLLKAGEAPFPSLVSLFKYSAELERLARGAATSRLEGDVSVVVQPKEYINLSPDECGSEL